ncbi:MAG: S49 family peptidase, partial [Thermoprotei archaeon]
MRHRYLALALVLAISISSACLYYSWSRWLRKGYIGVIRIRGYILSPSIAEAYSELAREAAANDSIRAVVLVIDSFGGYSDYVEQIYLDFKELGEKKPLIALVVNALSGGYYVAVAADYIFVHPTSFVGAIGVIALAPPMLIPSEIVLETGPYKHTGFRRLLFFYNLSHALDAFIGAVEEGRGSRLRASRAEL